ncbi:hypothetical protein RHS03_03328, partial [Rhizoctonia solani]
MFKSSVVASAVLLSGFANAFYDSVPFLAWSNYPSLVIDALMEQNPTVPSHAQILNSLMSTDELCSLDAMILHANKLSSPPHKSHLKTRLQQAPAKVHFPYIPVSSVPETDVVARDVAALCGFAADEWSLGSSYHGTSKRVIYFDLPESTEKFWSSDDETLEQNLDQIISQFNSYAIFLSGTSSSVSTLVTKRQQPNSLSRPNFVNQPHTITTFANATLPTGGILARYQLLTPGLLTALIITFGLLIPLLMVGINALAGIQSPLRTESPKGPSLEKKNQTSRVIQGARPTVFRNIMRQRLSVLGGISGTISFPAIKLTGANTVEGPGVAIYIRNNQDIHPQFSDISPIHKDILAIDLKLHNSPVTIINCYPHGKSFKDTVEAITNINIPMDRPCIMAGDFNMHHPDWALNQSKWEHHRPNAQERLFRTYAEYQDLHILNHLNLPTHIVPRSHTSNAIIDLTLLNSQAVDAWPNLNWEVEAQFSGKSLGLDHMAITWTIGPHNQAEPVEVTEPSPRHIIDTSCQKKWTQEYMRQVQKTPLPTDPRLAKEADRITSSILEAMSNATKIVMPTPSRQKKPGPVRSPWWTDECSEAVHNLKHNPDQKPREQLRASLHGAIRRAKKHRGDKILAEISTQRVFDVLKWYQGKQQSILPPIHHPVSGITATHPHNKARCCRHT